MVNIIHYSLISLNLSRCLPYAFVKMRRLQAAEINNFVRCNLKLPNYQQIMSAKKKVKIHEKPGKPGKGNFLFKEVL